MATGTTHCWSLATDPHAQGSASVNFGRRLTSIGGAAIVVGAVIAFYGILSNCDTDSGTCAGNPGLEKGGGVVSAAGLAVLVGGLVLLVSHAHSKASQSLATLRGPARPDNGRTRMPMWNDTTRATAAGLPTPVGIPLFSLHL